MMPTRRTIGRWLAALGAAVAVAATAACSVTNPPPQTPGESSITVVTHDSFSLDENLVKAFTERTGVQVKFTSPGDAGTLVNQLILTKDSPLGDVAFGVDNTFAGRALDAKVFTDYRSPALPESGTEYAESALTPIDRGDVCLNIDKQWFAAKKLPEPRTFDDLVKPEYRNLLVVTNPASSSPGLAFLIATINAKGDAWPEYWRQLKANGAKVVDSWTIAYTTEFSGSEGKGPRPIVLSYSSSPSAEVDASTGQSRTGALLDTCFRQVEYAGIISGTKNPDGAKKFVDFLLSDPVQASLPKSMYVYPINSAVPLPEAWAKFAPLATRPHTMPVADINTHRDQWLKQWKALGN